MFHNSLSLNNKTAASNRNKIASKKKRVILLLSLLFNDNADNANTLPVKLSDEVLSVAGFSKNTLDSFRKTDKPVLLDAETISDVGLSRDLLDSLIYEEAVSKKGVARFIAEDLSADKKAEYEAELTKIKQALESTEYRLSLRDKHYMHELEQKIKAQKEIKRLEEERKLLQIALGAKQNEVANAAFNRVHQLTGERDALQNRIDILETQLNAQANVAPVIQGDAQLQAEINRVQNELAGANNDRNDLRNRINALEAQLNAQQNGPNADQLIAERDALQGQLGASNQRIIQLEADLAAANARPSQEDLDNANARIVVLQAQLQNAPDQGSMDGLRNQLNQLTAERDALQGQLTQANGTINDLQARPTQADLNAANALVADLQNRLNQAPTQAMIDSLTVQLETANTNARAIQAQFDAAQNRIRELQDRLDVSVSVDRLNEANARIQTLENELAQLRQAGSDDNTRIADLNAALTQANRDKDALQAELNNRPTLQQLADANARVSDLERELRNAQLDIDGLDQVNARLRTEADERIKNLTDQLDEAKEQKTALETELNARPTQVDLDLVNAEVNRLQDELNATNRELDSLRAAQDASAATADENVSRIQELTENVAKLTQEKRNIEDLARNLETELIAAKEEIVSLKGKLSTAETDLETAKNELISMTGQYEAAEQSVRELKTDLDAAKQSNEELVVLRNRLTEEVEGLKNQLTQKQKENKKIKKEQEAEKKKVASLQGELDALRNIQGIDLTVEGLKKLLSDRQHLQKVLEDKVALENAKSDLEQSLSDHQNNINQLRGRISDLEGNAAQSSDKISALESKEAELQANIDRLSAQGDASQVEIGGLKTELAAVTQEKQHLEAQLSQRDQSLSENDAELNRLRNELAEVVSARDTLAGSDSVKDQKLVELNAELSQLNERLTAVSEEKENLKKAGVEKNQELTAKTAELRGIEGQLAETARVRDELAQSNSVKDKDLSDLNARVEALTAEIDGVRKEKEAESGKVNNFEQQLEQSKQELVRLRETLDSTGSEKDSRIASLSTLVSEAESANAELQGQYNKMVSSQARAESEHHTLVEKLEAEKSEIKAKLDELNRQIKTASKDAKAKDKNIANLTEERDSLVSQLQSVREELTALKTSSEASIERLEEALKAKDVEISRINEELNRKLAEHQQAMTDKQAELDSLHNARTFLEAQLSAAKASHEEYISQLQSSNDQSAAELQRQLTDAQSEKAVNLEKISTLENDIKKVSDELAALQTSSDSQAADQDAQIARLTEEKAALQNELENLQGSMAGKDAVITQLTRELEEFKSSSATLGAEKIRLTEELEQARNELETANNTNAANKTVLEDKVAALEARIKQMEDAAARETAELSKNLHSSNIANREFQDQIKSLEADLKKAKEAYKKLSDEKKALERQLTETGDDTQRAARLSEREKEELTVQLKDMNAKLKASEEKVIDAEARYHGVMEQLSLKEVSITELTEAKNNLTQERDLKALAITELQSQIEALKAQEQALQAEIVANKQVSEDYLSKVQAFSAFVNNSLESLGSAEVSGRNNMQALEAAQRDSIMKSFDLVKFRDNVRNNTVRTLEQSEDIVRDNMMKSEEIARQNLMNAAQFSVESQSKIEGLKRDFADILISFEKLGLKNIKDMHALFARNIQVQQEMALELMTTKAEVEEIKKQLNDSASQSESSKNALQSQLDEKIAKVSELESATQSLQRDLDSKVAELSAKLEEIANLKEALDAAGEASKAADARIAVAESDIAEKANEITDLKAQLDQSSTDADKEMSDVRAKLQAAEAEKTALQTALEETQSALEESRVDNQALSDDLEEKHGQLKDITASFKELDQMSEARLNTLTAALDSSEGSKTQLNDEMSLLRATLDERHADIQRLSGELDSKTAAYTKLESALKDIESAKSALEAKVQQMTDEHGASLTQASEGAMKARNEMIGRLFNVVNSDSGDLAADADPLQSLETVLKAREEKLTQQTQALVNSETQLSAMQAEMDRASQNLSQMQADVSASLNGVAEDITSSYKMSQDQYGSYYDLKYCEARLSKLEEKGLDAIERIAEYSPTVSPGRFRGKVSIAQEYIQIVTNAEGDNAQKLESAKGWLKAKIAEMKSQIHFYALEAELDHLNQSGLDQGRTAAYESSDNPILHAYAEYLKSLKGSSSEMNVQAAKLWLQIHILEFENKFSLTRANKLLIKSSNQQDEISKLQSEMDEAKNRIGSLEEEKVSLESVIQLSESNMTQKMDKQLSDLDMAARAKMQSVSEEFLSHARKSQEDANQISVELDLIKKQLNEANAEIERLKAKEFKNVEVQASEEKFAASDADVQTEDHTRSDSPASKASSEEVDIATQTVSESISAATSPGKDDSNSDELEKQIKAKDDEIVELKAQLAMFENDLSVEADTEDSDMPVSQVEMYCESKLKSKAFRDFKEMNMSDAEYKVALNALSQFEKFFGNDNVSVNKNILGEMQYLSRRIEKLQKDFVDFDKSKKFSLGVMKRLIEVYNMEGDPITKSLFRVYCTFLQSKKRLDVFERALELSECELADYSSYIDSKNNRIDFDRLISDEMYLSVSNLLNSIDGKKLTQEFAQYLEKEEFELSDEIIKLNNSFVKMLRFLSENMDFEKMSESLYHYVTSAVDNAEIEYLSKYIKNFNSSIEADLTKINKSIDALLWNLKFDNKSLSADAGSPAAAPELDKDLIERLKKDPHLAFQMAFKFLRADFDNASVEILNTYQIDKPSLKSVVREIKIRLSNGAVQEFFIVSREKDESFLPDTSSLNKRIQDWNVEDLPQGSEDNFINWLNGKLPEGQKLKMSDNIAFGIEKDYDPLINSQCATQEGRGVEIKDVQISDDLAESVLSANFASIFLRALPYYEKKSNAQSVSILEFCKESRGNKFKGKNVLYNYELLEQLTATDKFDYFQDMEEGPVQVHSQTPKKTDLERRQDPDVQLGDFYIDDMFINNQDFVLDFLTGDLVENVSTIKNIINNSLFGLKNATSDNIQEIRKYIDILWRDVNRGNIRTISDKYAYLKNNRMLDKDKFVEKIGAGTFTSGEDGVRPDNIEKYNACKKLQSFNLEVMSQTINEDAVYNDVLKLLQSNLFPSKEIQTLDDNDTLEVIDHDKCELYFDMKSESVKYEDTIWYSMLMSGVDIKDVKANMSEVSQLTVDSLKKKIAEDPLYSYIFNMFVLRAALGEEKFEIAIRNYRQGSISGIKKAQKIIDKNNFTKDVANKLKKRYVRDDALDIILSRMNHSLYKIPNFIELYNEEDTPSIASRVSMSSAAR